jgi:transposase-like protein
MKAKKAKGSFPQTLVQAVKYFGNPDNALKFMVSIRWPDGVVKCPTCGSDKVSFLSTRRTWKCKASHPKQQFSVKVGTIMEDSPIGLDNWLCAFWLIANCKNGISSYELAKDLGVTQKTAWFMNHRIRLAMQESGTLEMMKGQVEVDETFIGGKARNMKHSKRKEIIGRHGHKRSPFVGKTSRVKLKVVKTTKRKELWSEVEKGVQKGAEVFTDSLKSYEGLDEQEYVHKVIDHAECYAKGEVHTNGLQNFWSLLKRGILGTYVSVEPFHLFRYLDEQAFRFNERKDNDAGRFIKAVAGYIGKGLRYAKLTGKVADDGLPQAPMPWQTKWMMNDIFGTA